MFCKTDFFSFNQVWNTTDPDFSPCFHKTVLLWIPLGYLILLTPLRILLLHKSSSHFIIPWSWKTRIRLALAFVLGLLASIDIGRSIYEHLNGGGVPTVDFLSPLSIVLAMVAFCVVVFYERKNSVQSSGFLFIFWALLLLVSIFNLRSQIRVANLEGKVEDMFSLVTFSLFFAVVVIQFILACVVVDSTPVGAIPIDDTNPCPEHHVSFISQITFWWFSRIVVQGYKRALVLKDLWSLNPEDKCRNVYPQFERYWNAELARCKRLHLTGKEEPREIELKEMGAKRQERIPEVAVAEAECKKSSPRLFWAIVKTFGPKSFVAAAFKVVFDMMQFTSPIILKYLIEYTANKDVQNWKGYFYATLMLVLALIQSVVLHQYFYHCTVIGMRMRTAMIAAVYQKMLKLSNAARKTSTVGEIVNLMSVDAQRLMDMMTYVNMIWSGPLQITISIYLLWVTLGPSILAGVAFMIIMIPLNGVIANKFKEFQVKQMSLKDKRIKMMNEILNGIKVLKLYAWEPSFEKKVLDIRNKELDILKKMSYLNAVTTFTWTVVPFLVSLITFAVYVMVDKNNILDADKAFVSLSLFNILRFPLSMVPQVVSSLVQVNVSVKRLRDFLGADELDLEAVQYDDEAKSAVKLENASFVWDKELMEKDKTGPTLTGINLDVSEGQLIAVVGTVGSGKSSLLSAILGEMDRLSGSVTVKGSTAYVAQQAWIQNATLMDNVLFGKPFELSSYRKVIDACALQSDLEIMPAGDQTEIGEKGINLSGGQKQRVSLARAVFQDADMYLMDDPLSAVDSHVGKHIFDNVLGPNGLLKGKTRVLVTHGVGFLSQVDTIVVLVNGKISEIGSYKQLLDHDGAFSQFLKNYLTEEMSKEDADIELDPEIMSQIESTVEGQTDAKLQKQLSMLSERMRTMSDTNTATPPGTPGAVRRIKSKESLMASRTSLHKAPNGVEKDLKGAREEEKKLIEAEKMETQRVKLSVFLVYLKSVGVLLGVSTILFYILTNAANIYSNIWLSEWSNDANNRTVINGTVIVDTAQRDMRLGVYGLLGVVQGLTIIVGALSLNLGNLKAGKNLHAAMLENIIASPMSFYDTTPLGRILNRFASDIDTLDRRIPEILTSWIQVVLKVLSVPIVVGSITPLFLAAAMPLGLSYFIAQYPGVLSFGGAICLNLGGIKATHIIHNEFLDNTLRLPIGFFDITPVGRILNRFGRDVDVLDKDISIHYEWCLRTTMMVLSIVVVIAYSTPTFLLGLVPIAVLYFFIQISGRIGAYFCMERLFYEYPVVGVLEAFSAFIMAHSGIRASRELFVNLLTALMRVPVLFYDITPRGRILNRTTDDIMDIDMVMPFSVRSMVNVILVMLCTLGVIAATLHLFIIVIPLLAVVYFFIQRFYVATSRQLKRLESVSRSPIYSHFGETVMGVTTVRAYRQQTRFIETSEHKVDENLICHYPSIISNRWLAIRLELVGNCILFFAALFAVIARNDLSPGIVGLSITYALNITQTLNWMVRMTTELETNIVAVERVKEYSDTPTEADWEVKDKKPKADWPDAGIVEFEHYGTRYRPGLDLVVKDLNCKIQSGEKVGIVGRTGAGKSSLTLALFRIIEPAEGKIKIDGLDIKLMGLHDLRSKLTIIPQEPVLFSGPLRMNLDPFDEHSDEALWQALEHAHLKSFVSELPAKLEHECTEGGENLSVGQRQLVCLARALLRKTKILVLDEATAAVDLETDDLIQHTIRVEFKDATVLTIAHRLNTIMDYNRVMVLDQGNLREFDSPPALLQNEDSIFYNMAKDAGLA